MNRIIKFIINREWEQKSSPVKFPLCVLQGDTLVIDGVEYRVDVARKFDNMNELREAVKL